MLRRLILQVIPAVLYCEELHLECLKECNLSLKEYNLSLLLSGAAVAADIYNKLFISKRGHFE
jgi:hypothetical protein